MNPNATELVTPPELIENYTLLRLLGEGANGKTYLARHRWNGDNVAIKSLKLSESESLKGYELFQREAEVLKSITVQGVPKFYECILPQDSTGNNYIVQEYISHPSLADILEQEGPLPESTVFSLLLSVEEILVRLHAYKPPVIHRDIKPSNILVKIDQGAVDESFLIDFGAVANPQKSSSSSTVAGTYGYMAPEQMMGEVRVESDFYSIGATALHALTGVSPATLSSNVFQIDFDGVLAERAPNTSDGMKSLLKILLDPHPENRPKNAHELIALTKRAMWGGCVSLNDEDEVKPIIDPLKLPFFKRLLWRISNLFNASNKDIKHIIQINTDSWLHVPVTIQKIHTYASHVDAEYTFEIDGMPYCGWANLLEPYTRYLTAHMSIGDYIDQIAQIPCPQDGIAIYNPDDPRMNALISNNTIKEILDVLLEEFKVNKFSIDMSCDEYIDEADKWVNTMF